MPTRLACECDCYVGQHSVGGNDESPMEHRELAKRAPNFYAFRNSVFDFMTTSESKPGRDVPRLFISSTSEDLRSYRDQASHAAIAAHFLPRMMEYFTASGDKPPLEYCLREVSETDLLVVIVAHRYGWVPPDQPGDQRKSITWLEWES